MATLTTIAAPRYETLDGRPRNYELRLRGKGKCGDGCDRTRQVGLLVMLDDSAPDGYLSLAYAICQNCARGAIAAHDNRYRLPETTLPGFAAA